MSGLALLNGKIYTAAGFREAVLIDGERLVCVGENSDVKARMHEVKGDVEVIELDNNVVLPGFCDSHSHFMAWAATSDKLDVKGSKSVSEVREKLRQYMAETVTSEDTWIEGRGWNHEIMDEGRMITKDDLDDIAPANPVLLARVCGHIAVLNTAAMKKLGITRDFSLPGGAIDLGGDGEPNGIIRESVLEWTWRQLPPATKADMARLLDKYGKVLASYGLTTINSDDFSELNDNYELAIDFYGSAEREGKLPFRVRQQLLLRNPDVLRSFLATGWRTGMGGRYYKIGPLKLLCDGSLGGRTAWLRGDYADEPGTRGVPIYTQEELDELIWLAHSAGMQVATHAIGDATLDMCMNAMENAQRRRRGMERHLIVHCQIADDSQLKRLKDLGLGVAMQPCFVPSDREMAIKRLGEEKASHSYRWRTMLEMGIVMSAGSDAPVETYNPLVGIHAAVTRQDENDVPNGGWVPEERLSIAAALNLYTWASAWHANEESIRGEITEGKLADLVVLDRNIFTMKHCGIKDTKAALTICGGRITHRSML